MPQKVNAHIASPGCQNPIRSHIYNAPNYKITTATAIIETTEAYEVNQQPKHAPSYNRK